MAFPVAAIPIIAQTLMGGAQRLMGGAQARLAQDRFENAVAPSLLNSRAYGTARTTENLTQRWAQTGLPEQTMRFQQDMIGRSGAASLASAQGLRQGTMGLGATAQSLGDQYRSLASMDAQQRIANRGQWLQARQNVQGIEMQQADRDYGNFLNQQAARLAQMSAGRGMQSQGMQQLANAGVMAFQGALTPQEFGGFQGLFGGGGQSSPAWSGGYAQNYPQMTHQINRQGFMGLGGPTAFNRNMSLGGFVED